MLQIVVVTNIFSLTIYVTEDDKDYNSNLTVAKYENGIWTPLTQTDQTQFYGASPVVKVDSKNIPYLLFSLHRKYGSPYASKLFCYNNGGWQNDNPFIQTNKTDSMAEDDAIYSFIIGSDDRFCFLR